MNKLKLIFENLITVRVVLSLIYCFLSVLLMEYIKYMLSKNVKKEILWFIKDHILCFYPIIMTFLAAWLLRIDIIDDTIKNFIFNLLYYLAVLHLFFQVLYKAIIKRIKEKIEGKKK